MNQATLDSNKHQRSSYAIGGFVVGASAAVAVMFASYSLVICNNDTNEESSSLRGPSLGASTFVMSNHTDISSLDPSAVSNDDVSSHSSSETDINQPNITNEHKAVSLFDTHESDTNEVGWISKHDSVPTMNPSTFLPNTDVLVTRTHENLFNDNSPKISPTDDTFTYPTYQPTIEHQYPTNSPTKMDESAEEVKPMIRSHEVGFRLKKYWQSGYFWQENTRETWWCMSCEGGKCRSGGKLQIRDCKKKSEDDAQFSVIPHGISGDQIRVMNTDLCLEKMGTSRTITLKPCKEDSGWQRFIGVEQKGGKFDLRPINDAKRCLTNHHHPKSKEVIYAELCERAHRSKTSYWVTY